MLNKILIAIILMNVSICVWANNYGMTDVYSTHTLKEEMCYNDELSCGG
jgi:hypothetical protein